MKIGSKVKILRDLDGIHCEGCEGVIDSINEFGSLVFLVKVKFINKNNEELVCTFFEDELEVLK